MKSARDGDSSSLERSKTSSRLLTALNRCSGAEKRKESAQSPVQAAADAKDSENASSGDVKATDSNADDVAETPSSLFSVVEEEADTDPEPPSSKPPEPPETVSELEARLSQPQIAPYAYGVGPGPTAVIVRRKSSTAGASHRTCVSAEATFVTRRHQSRNDTSPNLVTRFSLVEE